ncbi:hypothetical protein BJF90_08990 [Pseudonocardia sp. CNS-004]|nr:hypothetical protein BJF90_08990 [Pseudonocardia sp. CNS-004]
MRRAGQRCGGHLVLAMAREGDEFDTYGCGFLAGGEVDDEASAGGRSPNPGSARVSTGSSTDHWTR